MKRLFTFAIVGLIASVAFAQSPVAKSTKGKLERVYTESYLTSKAKEAKAAKAVIAEKALAESESATSVVRHTATKHATIGQQLTITPMPGITFSAKNAIAGNHMYKAAPAKSVAQEGNLTITTDANGIITNVEGVDPTYYNRDGIAYFYNSSSGSTAMGYQSGMVETIEDGENVYMKNPVSKYTQGTWVKGVKTDNAITFAAGQPLAYNSNYGTTLSMRWGVITAAGDISAADSHADVFTFAIDGNTLSLEGTNAYGTVEGDAYFMGVFWDDDDSFTGYGDAETVLTLNADYEAPEAVLVELPAGAEVADWYANGFTLEEQMEVEVNNMPVKVAFVGNEVYVAGLSAVMSDAWVKGTITGNKIVFSKFQYLGTYSGAYDIWFTGVTVSGDMIDAEATYDSEAKTITFSTDYLANAASDRVYYLEWYFDMVLSAEKAVYEEPTITDLTATLPYINTFDTDAEIEQVAVYDANKDGKTFTFVSGAARYTYSSSNDGNDYLVFPGLPLKKGESYVVSIESRAQSAYYPERVEVLAGTEAKVSAFTIPVIPATDIEDAEYTTLANADFTVEEDGIYYFAVHAISDANSYYLFVDNFTVKANDPNAPSPVADLNAVANAQGENKATVTFTVPSATVGGAALSGNLDVKVTRDGEVVYNQSVAAGSAVSFEDEVSEPGTYNYVVVVADGEHVSDAAAVKVYIGVDVPETVENLTAADRSSYIEVSWDAPQAGVNGGVLKNIVYNIYPCEMVEFWGMYFPDPDFANPFVLGLDSTAAGVPFNTNEGEQGFTYLAVTAETAAGEGDYEITGVLTGKPYELPFKESVAGGSLSHYWGTNSDDETYYNDGGAYFTDDASDDDDKAIIFEATNEGWITLESGKIALGGAANPVLSFDVKSEGDAQLSISVVTPLDEEVVKTITPGEEYARESISLLDFADEDFIRIIFKGEFTDITTLTIDNIKVVNQLDNNLEVKILSAPAKVNAGQDVDVTVKVENQGTEAVAAADYTVDLYINGKKVQTAESKDLAADQTEVINFVVATDIFSPETLDIKVVAEYAADEDKDNNTAVAITTVVLPTYPTVEGLEAKAEEGGVELTWSAPDVDAPAAEAVTEEFEDYDAFGLEAGDWTLIDVDGSETYGFSGLAFENSGSPMAYIVFNNGGKFEDVIMPHSGSQVLASFAAASAPNDDWMISPELSGEAQEISFFAMTYTADYGAEEFEFLYSTTDKDINSFTAIAEEHNVPEVWTEYKYEVPAGAKYFAIRCISNNRFIFLVDDVTYVPASEVLEIVGYNVYRNGEKINEAPVEGTSYVDADGAADDKYAVSVVYTAGESLACAEVGVSTGINAVSSLSGVKVEGRNIVVKGAQGNVAVYTIDGKAIYSEAAAATNSINVAPGVYMVKYGKRVAKVAVK